MSPLRFVSFTERSQVAAGEIHALSTSSVDVAEQAGTLLDVIVPNIQKTIELVQEIAAARKEQVSGAEQINRSIQPLDSVIQQNASAAEEMASTTEELSSQADQLQQLVAFFVVDEAGAAQQSSVYQPQTEWGRSQVVLPDSRSVSLEKESESTTEVLIDDAPVKQDVLDNNFENF